MWTYIQTDDKYKPYAGTHTYGAPVTIHQDSDTCNVPGMRYWNKDDPITSPAMPGLLSYADFGHNIEDSTMTTESCERKKWYHLFKTCTNVIDASTTCGQQNGGCCGWIIDCAYNMGMYHLNYGEWDY